METVTAKTMKKQIEQYMRETAYGQMTAEELVFVMDNLPFPCRLLVFGLGADTKIWLDLNRDGFTTFVEDDPKWIAKHTAKVDPQLGEIRQVEYWTQSQKFPEYLDDPRLVLTELGHNYQAVFVDAPFGAKHGRCQSIATAAAIRDKTQATVLVHDCHRPLESAYCLHYLGKNFQSRHHVWAFD